MQQKLEHDPMTAASDAYKLLFENDRVRVLQVTFKPGYTAKMHDHPDHVVYVLKGGKIRFFLVDRVEEMDLVTGTAVFLDAQRHKATNVGDSDVELIAVELKK